MENDLGTQLTSAEDEKREAVIKFAEAEGEYETEWGDRSADLLRDNPRLNTTALKWLLWAVRGKEGKLNELWLSMKKANELKELYWDRVKQLNRLYGESRGFGRGG